MRDVLIRLWLRHWQDRLYDAKVSNDALDLSVWNRLFRKKEIIYSNFMAFRWINQIIVDLCHECYVTCVIHRADMYVYSSGTPQNLNKWFICFRNNRLYTDKSNAPCCIILSVLSMPQSTFCWLEWLDVSVLLIVRSGVTFSTSSNQRR